MGDTGHHADPQVWQPLNAGDTRILILHPGTAEEPLRVDLHRIAISSEKRPSLSGPGKRIVYEALSYTWGVPNFSHSIECNGAKVNITKNLFDALQHLRQEHERRRLWVDALCIHQADDQEKSLQIPRMKDIYRYATQVVVWLGDAEEYTDDAVWRLRWFAGKLKEAEKRRVPPRDHEILEDEPLTLHEELGLYDLTRRHWMYRVWVVQEMAAAQSIAVQIGPHTIRWTTFILVHRLLIRIARSFDMTVGTQSQTISSLSRSNMIDTIVKERQHEKVENALLFLDRMSKTAIPGKISHSPENPWMQFYRLLYDTRHYRATDERDRVFALLALSNVPVHDNQVAYADKPGIHIDYTRTVAEVFAEVTFYMLTQIKSDKAANPRDSGEMSLFDYFSQRVEIPSWTTELLSQLNIDTPANARESRERRVVPTLSLLNYFSRHDDLPSWCFDFRQNRIPELDPSFWRFRPSWFSPTAVPLSRDAREPLALRMRGWQIGVVQEGVSLNVAGILDRASKSKPARNPSSSRFHALVPTEWKQAFHHFAASRPEPFFHQCEIWRFFPQLQQDREITTDEKKSAAVELLIHDLENDWRWEALGSVEPGDIMVESLGLTDPVVLRPRSRGGYILVGTVQSLEYVPDGDEDMTDRRLEISRHVASYPANFVELATWTVDDWDASLLDWVTEEEFIIH